MSAIIRDPLWRGVCWTLLFEFLAIAIVSLHALLKRGLP